MTDRNVRCHKALAATEVRSVDYGARLEQHTIQRRMTEAIIELENF